jgi:hypothetical protein
MALPSSGQLSLGNIRAELGMSSTSNFSLFKASTSATGYPILNPYSPVKPNNLSPYAISEWYGYSSATIYWYNGFNNLGGASNLKIYVNGVLVLNNTNSVGVGISGTLVINNGDTFYATMTPITYGGFFGTTAQINTFRYVSPFGVFDYNVLNITQITSGAFTPFSSPTQTATIQAVNLAVFEIDAFC